MVKCSKCGNDGSAGALFLTIDARRDAAANGWTLEEREDDGGRSLDCLVCDARTPVTGEEAQFPYGQVVRPAAPRTDVPAGGSVAVFLDGLEASMDGRGYNGDHERARLVLEAADDLLAAGKAYAAFSPHQSNRAKSLAWDALRAAIDKATGR